MPNYLILQDPGHNRVYFQASEQLALAELAVLCEHQGWSEPSVKNIAGIRYLHFYSPSALHDQQRERLAQLSASYALFSSNQAFDQLTPEPMSWQPLIADKISSLQKYPGKTNEHFTRLMINMARFALPTTNSPLHLLDPVAGRGTTLFEALALGMNATGIEQDNKSVHETRVFFKKFLMQERIKHHHKQQRVAGTNKQNAINAELFSFGADKTQLKNQPQTLTLIEADTQNTKQCCKKNYFDLVVGDLPYGIAHCNKAQGLSSRNPVELVNQAAPEWHSVMRKGGVIALAWNAHLISRTELAKSLESAGFSPLNQPPYQQLLHRVDSSIKRDILVAIKP